MCVARIFRARLFVMLSKCERDTDWLTHWVNEWLATNHKQYDRENERFARRERSMGAWIEKTLNFNLHNSNVMRANGCIATTTMTVAVAAIDRDRWKSKLRIACKQTEMKCVNYKHEPKQGKPSHRVDATVLKRIGSNFVQQIKRDKAKIMKSVKISQQEAI